MVGDAHRLPFARACANVIICRQSIHYFDFPDVVLAEIKRVLASDGRLLIAQIVPFENPEDQEWWKTSCRTSTTAASPPVDRRGTGGVAA